MNETWKPVVGWEDRYEVSSDGRVRSLPKSWRIVSGGTMRREGKELSQFTNHHGYRCVTLTDTRKRHAYRGVHRLMLYAFRGPPLSEDMQCRHLDGNPANNTLANLCWGTVSENQQDIVKHGRRPIGNRHPCAKLSDADVEVIRGMTMRRGDLTRLAHEYGVTRTALRRAYLGKTWKHIAKEAA